jgi:hypothetical protein
MRVNRQAAGGNRTGGAQHFLRWAALALVLHGPWEAAHLPLYALWDDPDRRRVFLYLLHCTAGDVLIASVQYSLVAALFLNLAWPMQFPWRGGLIAIVAGLGYTGFSGWYNVYQAHAWSYSASMPLVYGVGLTPLLQWLVVPVLTIIAFRYRNRDY